ncbi:MAG: HAMP domain-containing histidine kinase [Anaerolineae bacterium]|nr:HAMP domain-containing histidine kinase [Anaerolineae bacterium]
MSTPHNSTSHDPVTNMVQSVDSLGESTVGFFERIFVGLRRKQEREAYRVLTHEAARLRHDVASQRLRVSQLAGVLAAISEGVIMQDTQGKIVLMNDAARALIGSVRYFRTSLLGRMFEDSKHQAAPNGGIVLGEAQRVEVNQRVIGAQIAVVSSPEGDRLGTVLMLRDVTHDALADRLKSQFITQMSHELRTPLASIKGMSEVLLAMPADRPPNRKFLEAISRNVAVLDRMVVELLDISEIGAGSFAVRQQPVEIPSLVFDAWEGVQQDAERADLTFSVQVVNSDRLTVIGDDRRLHWAINHLLDNAIKYTEPGGMIVLVVGRIRDGHITLEISDTGVGISPDDLPYIFDQFYRGEARTPDGRVIDPRGLGQGLFVARAVAEAHGGYVSVASLVGQGSTFKLALPLPEVDAPALPLAEMPAAPDPEAVDAVLPDSADPPPPDQIMPPEM